MGDQLDPPEVTEVSGPAVPSRGRTQARPKSPAAFFLQHDKRSRLTPKETFQIKKNKDGTASEKNLLLQLNQ